MRIRLIISQYLKGTASQYYLLTEIRLTVGVGVGG